MSSRIAAFALVAFLLIPGATLQAGLTGVVITRDGVPVGGARVSAYALESSAEAQARLLSENPARKALVSGETNRDGMFGLDVDPAIVDVLIGHDGLAPASVRMLKNENVGTVLARPAATKTGRVTGPGGA